MNHCARQRRPPLGAGKAGARTPAAGHATGPALLVPSGKARGAQRSAGKRSCEGRARDRLPAGCARFVERTRVLGRPRASSEERARGRRGDRCRLRRPLSVPASHRRRKEPPLPRLFIPLRKRRARGRWAAGHFDAQGECTLGKRAGPRGGCVLLRAGEAVGVRRRKPQSSPRYERAKTQSSRSRL